MGRLVQTHSTYIEGLIDVLKILKKDKDVKTLTPGVIFRVKSHSDNLRIKITRQVPGGYKTIVKKGRSAQELYILTSCKRYDLESKIKDCILKNH